MNTNLSYFLLALFLFISLTISSQDKKQRNINIMTYNIRNGIGMDDVADYKRTADVIRKWNPNIVAIQEIDSMTNRSKQRFVIQEIANLLDMFYEYAPAIDYDGGKYGIGMLSKEKPLTTHYIALPGSEEKRTLLISEFSEFFFICVHLSLTLEDQISSINVINQELKKMSKPVFIAGDFNAEPHSKPINLLQENFKVLSPFGAKTYPADFPTEAIDYIVVDLKNSNKFKIESSFVADESTASDHRPILVVISK